MYKWLASQKPYFVFEGYPTYINIDVIPFMKYLYSDAPKILQYKIKTSKKEIDASALQPTNETFNCIFMSWYVAHKLKPQERDWILFHEVGHLENQHSLKSIVKSSFIKGKGNIHEFRPLWKKYNSGDYRFLKQELESDIYATENTSVNAAVSSLKALIIMFGVSGLGADNDAFIRYRYFKQWKKINHNLI